MNINSINLFRSYNAQSNRVNNYSNNVCFKSDESMSVDEINDLMDKDKEIKKLFPSCTRAKSFLDYLMLNLMKGKTKIEVETTLKEIIQKVKNEKVDFNHRFELRNPRQQFVLILEEVLKDKESGYSLSNFNVINERMSEQISICKDSPLWDDARAEFDWGDVLKHLRINKNAAEAMKENAKNIYALLKFNSGESVKSLLAVFYHTVLIPNSINEFINEHSLEPIKSNTSIPCACN